MFVSGSSGTARSSAPPSSSALSFSFSLFSTSSSASLVLCLSASLMVSLVCDGVDFGLVEDFCGMVGVMEGGYACIVVIVSSPWLPT